jgi:D-arginine dehydrogenase
MRSPIFARFFNENNLMKNYRVIIIGGGILGASVAYSLAEYGETDVLVLEAEPALNLHSTGRSAAYYIPMYESKAYASLAKASLGFLKNPPEGFSARPLFSQDGAVIAAIEGRAKGVIDEMAEAKELGIDVERISGRQIVELVPIARPELVEVAAFYPEAGEIEVDLLTDSYRAAATRKGVSFETGNAFKDTLIEDGEIAGVLATSGKIGCEYIVNAAGAWAGRIGKTIGRSLPLAVLRRHLMKVDISDAWPSKRSPFYRCPSLPLYYKLVEGELAFSPMDATPDEPRDCPVDVACIEDTTKILNAYTTLSVRADQVTAVAGHRVFASDHGPLVGSDPWMPKFYWGAALGGSGIMAAPVVGNLVASGILGREITMEMSSISPARFQQEGA